MPDQFANPLSTVLYRDKNPGYLEELNVGSVFFLASRSITQELLDAHVKLYGEDWPELMIASTLGAVPSPIVLSIAEGQMGERNYFRYQHGVSAELRFLKPFLVGDSVSIRCTIVESRPSKDPNKDYGYVSLDQEFLNQNDEVCYRRKITYTVQRLPRSDHDLSKESLRP